MEYPSMIIKELVDELCTLPGIGKRTALRMVLNLLKKEDVVAERLGNLILQLKSDIVFCKSCHSISDEEICIICRDKRRDVKSICVVEDHKDLIAIENTQQYKGLFHVLGGLISPLDGVGPEKLNISSLLDRVGNELTDELIFALSATMEGDTTMFYIAKQINDKDVKISAISRGISIGGELEYADEITLGRSIQNRTPFKI